MEALREKSAFDFFGTLHLQRYLAGHNGYIAGGCFKNIFKKEKVKDIDIFFETEEDFKYALKIFQDDEDYTDTYQNENAVGFYDKDKDVEVELIRSSFLPVDQMISSFDFTITKFALYLEEEEQDLEKALEEAFEEEEQDEDRDEKTSVIKRTTPKVVYHEDFFEHLTLNRLVIDGDMIDFPLNTFDRMLRYAKYGYAPCTGTKAKIARAINSATLPADDGDLFRGFYVGID